jgi:hypothetical protein
VRTPDQERRDRIGRALVIGDLRLDSSASAGGGTRMFRSFVSEEAERVGFWSSRTRTRDHLSRLTPREIASTESSKADTDSVAISSFARGDNGMVSVGLNAEELVTET